VADILDAATERLEGRFEHQPLVEADIRFRLAMMYRRLGDPRASIPHLARSYQLRRELFGEHKSPTNYTKNYLALALGGAGRYSEAERLFDELLEPYPKNLDKSSDKAVLFPTMRCNLACVYIEQGRYEEAERLLIGTFERWPVSWKSWNPKGNPYLGHLAETYLSQDRYDEAEQQFDQFMSDQGDDALGHGTMPSLGYVYMAQDRYKEAEDLFTRGIEYGKRELPGKDHPTTLGYMNGLAILRTKQKQYEQAESLFHDTLEARKAKQGDDHPRTLETKNDLAVLYKKQGDYAKAEPLLCEAFEGRSLKIGDTHPHTLQSLNNLIDLYEGWNKPEKANEWRAKLIQIEDFEE
jgi:tetratricopeptide (TPR) repeat protein